MINFSRVARQLNEDQQSIDAESKASEDAARSSEKQISNNAHRKARQKDQSATQRTTNVKSDVSYASEESRKEREYIKMFYEKYSDWREELMEAAGVDPDEGEHPYVDIMPMVNQKAMDAKKQLKAAGKAGEKQAFATEEMTVKQQMEFMKKNPLKPVPKGGYDHAAIRAKQMSKAPKSTKKKDMTSATDPRPGSNFRGD